MMLDIKPCPFCGGSNVLFEATVCNAIVICTDCRISGPDGDRFFDIRDDFNNYEALRKDKAISLWNRRGV
jgi:Lar family restriction alleviation protein